jgi:hypothetical protein
MTFHFNYQSSFLLFFFLQGLVFAFLLLKKGREHNHQASRWLSLFVFLCCLYLCPWMFGHSNWYAMDGYREFLFFMPFQQLFLIGPVIYFYAQSLLDPSYRFQRKDWWHFGPALLYLLYSLVIFVVDHLVLDEYYFYARWAGQGPRSLVPDQWSGFHDPLCQPQHPVLQPISPPDI